MRRLCMRHFRRVEHSAIVCQGSWWSMVSRLQWGDVRCTVIVRVISRVTERIGLSSLHSVGGQVRGLRVGHFRCIYYPSVLGQGSWWTVVRRAINGVRSITRQGCSRENNAREEELKNYKVNVKTGYFEFL